MYHWTSVVRGLREASELAKFSGGRRRGADANGEMAMRGKSDRAAAAARCLREKLAFMTRVRMAPTASSSAEEAVRVNDPRSEPAGGIGEAGALSTLGMEPRFRWFRRRILLQSMPSSSACVVTPALTVNGLPVLGVRGGDSSAVSNGGLDAVAEGPSFCARFGAPGPDFVGESLPPSAALSFS